MGNCNDKTIQIVNQTVPDVVMTTKDVTEFSKPDVTQQENKELPKVEVKNKKVERVKENLKETKKSIILSDGSFYEGDWDSEKYRQGFGICKFIDKDKYMGYWANNVPNGFGKVDFRNGVTFEGQFLNGKANGYGELIESEVYQYKGGFKSNQKSGVGLKIIGDISYEGEFKNDMKNGHGVLRFKNGSYYEVN